MATKHTIPFFIPNDISEIANIGNKVYNKDSTRHVNIVNSIKDNGWEKTKYWYTQTINQIEGFTGECKKYWSKREWRYDKRVITFKPYTWAKIYKEEYGGDIFFTVGIDAESMALVYKLDYQFDGTSDLTYEQKEVCEKLIKSTPAAWIEISKDNLIEYDWESLINETVDFINKYSKLYEEVVNSVSQINQYRIARITYNLNGWVMPSGKYGKSTDPESHEARFGYGHEEWLFDTGKLIDGYHYSFLEPIRKEQEAYTGNTYKVWLYTIDGVSKKRFWIGEIKNLEALDNETAINIKSVYKDKGWLKEMENQIKLSNANSKGFSNAEGVDIFNVRYKPEDLQVNDPYFELPENHPVKELSRYIFAYFKKEFGLDLYKDEDSFSFTSNENDSDDGNDDVETNSHEREPRTIEITYFHRAISKKLTKVLKKKYGGKNVTSEHKSGVGACKVDIIVNSKDEGLLFYEIKTYNSLKTSIREALGQLLEYSLWPNKNKANKLIIVTQKQNDIETAKIYVEHLRTAFKIPIYYQWFDIKTNELSELY